MQQVDNHVTSILKYEHCGGNYIANLGCQPTQCTEYGWRKLRSKDIPGM